MLYQQLYEHYRRQNSNYTEDSVTLNTQHSFFTPGNRKTTLRSRMRVAHWNTMVLTKFVDWSDKCFKLSLNSSFNQQQSILIRKKF